MHKHLSAFNTLRTRCACSCSPATTSRRAALPQVRFAHAASFADEVGGDERNPPPGRQQHQQQQRRSCNRAASDYRFPTKGRRGGAPDPYEILALERGASGADIKSAYYALALVLHPDSSHPSASAEHFATLNKAYKLLSTPAGRNSYLQTGYGWHGPGGTFDTDYAEDSADAAMREMIRRARAAGASEWRPRGFRDSDAGRGAWQYRNVNGQQWHPYDADGPCPTPTGDELYMSNNRFVMIVAVIAGIWAYVQFVRIGGIHDSTRDHLIDRHIHASKALEEARAEAAMFGKERREQLRRRVRENSVLAEIENMERGGGVRHNPPAVSPASLEAPPPAPPSSSPSVSL